MNQHLESAGIRPISKEDYIKECKRGLEIMAISTCGSGQLPSVAADDVLMVSMCKPGGDKPVVSYVRLGTEYLFTHGWPWVATPLSA